VYPLQRGEQHDEKSDPGPRGGRRGAGAGERARGEQGGREEDPLRPRRDAQRGEDVPERATGRRPRAASPRRGGGCEDGGRDRDVHGYSGLWFCLALQDTGGRLITFEIDPGRAAAARKNFQQAGVESLVTVVEGNAHEKLATVKGPVDVAFIDADKEGYVDYLRKLLPLLRPGGLLLAHNVGMAGVTEYLKEAEANPDLETIIYREGAGLAVTLKKR